MQTVEISISYMTKGKCVTNAFKTNTKDPQVLFDNAVSDANLFAYLHKGQVSITRKINSLYINYFNVQCEVIDRMYLIK